MKSHLVKGVVAAAGLIWAAAPSHAQEVKIGYVNSDRVLRESLPAKTATSKLETEFSKREKELKDMDARLKAAGEKFERDSPSLMESDKARRQRELADQDRELVRKRRMFQEDLSQRKSEELAAVVERAQKVIEKIAKDEKYDIVVQEVLYASGRADITEKVIKALDAQAGK